MNKSFQPQSSHFLESFRLYYTALENGNSITTSTKMKTEGMVNKSMGGGKEYAGTT